VTALLFQRLAKLKLRPDLLCNSLRGIEKEGLRVDLSGNLSTRPHPVTLGSALTHPRITTDYSEALLELITGTHTRVGDLLTEINEVQRIVSCTLDGELMWNHSMPATLPPEADIPIAWYGTSNTGMLKHVYRRGLAERYGKTMQCIAGLHYNFSFDEQLWDLLDLPGDTQQNRRSAGYIALIRNFTRYSWLLMYLFGASPALSRDFLRGSTGGLQELDPQTLYLPHATSLRMSDLGYQNKAQSGLKPCYNDLNTFLQRIYDAVTTPWPAYAEKGTHRDGQWIQLNTNILQIENEFYSSIRPKRTTGRCERPITALAERGVQYIEVRCLDIDPTEPTGISAQTARFVDAFLLFCATSDSPYFGESGFCPESAENFSLVVKRGREPGLMLSQQGKKISLTDWATDLLDQISQCADSFGQALKEPAYNIAVAEQRAKVGDASLTPSAKLLEALREQHVSFHQYALQTSQAHAENLRKIGLAAEEANQAQLEVKQSLAEQKSLEEDETESFDDYVARFHQALKAPKIS
jgi:glutamate--cysteine ligase